MNGEGRVVCVKQPNEWGGQSGVCEAAKQEGKVVYVKQLNEWGGQSGVCEAAKRTGRAEWCM